MGPASDKNHLELRR